MSTKKQANGRPALSWQEYRALRLRRRGSERSAKTSKGLRKHSEKSARLRMAMRKHQLARAICEDQVGVAQVMLDGGKAREYVAKLKGKTLVCYRCEKEGNTGLFRGDFQICKHCGYMSPLYYDTVLPERSSKSMLLYATWLFGFRPERPFVQRIPSRTHNATLAPKKYRRNLATSCPVNAALRLGSTAPRPLALTLSPSSSGSTPSYRTHASTNSPTTASSHPRPPCATSPCRGPRLPISETHTTTHPHRPRLTSTQTRGGPVPSRQGERHVG